MISPTPLKDVADAFIDPDDIVDNRELSDEKTFTSLYSLRDLDERLSQDISCTFPMSRKISVVNGVENRMIERYVDDLILGQNPLDL